MHEAVRVGPQQQPPRRVVGLARFDHRRDDLVRMPNGSTSEAKASKKPSIPHLLVWWRDGR
jgi:hypothetical protein